MKRRINMEVEDNVRIEVRRASDDELLDVVTRHNLVTNLGLAGLCECLANGTTNKAWIDKFLFGTGTASPAGTDTALGTKVFEDIPTRRTIASQTLKLWYYMGVTTANGYTLSEAGLWTKAGELFARATHPGIAKNNTVTLTYTWDIAFNPA